MQLKRPRGPQSMKIVGERRNLAGYIFFAVVFLPKWSNFLPIYLHFGRVEQPETGKDILYFIFMAMKKFLTKSWQKLFQGSLEKKTWSPPQKEDASDDAKIMWTWLQRLPAYDLGWYLRCANCGLTHCATI